MKKLILLFAVFQFSQGCIKAQVLVNYIQPEFNKWHTEDMWNLMITNLSDKPVTIVMNGTLEESKKGMIAKGSTSELTLVAKYSGSVAFEDLLPVDIKFLGDINYQEVYEKTGSLPVGSYTICVYVKDSKSGVELAKDCYSFQISPAAPPILLSPVDKTQISEKLPLFTWLPPMPPVGNNTNYLLEIVETHANQTPVEAMKSNSRWLSEKDINSTTFQYPVAGREFEIGKTYSWQITAFEGRNEIGKSEVWSFSYNTEFNLQIDSIKIAMLNPAILVGGDILYLTDTSSLKSGNGTLVVLTGGDIMYAKPDGIDQDCDGGTNVILIGGDILYLTDCKGNKIYDFIELKKGDIVKRTKTIDGYEYSIETDRRYFYEIYITNTNSEDAIFSILGVEKTKPKCKSPIVIKGEKSVVIKSGDHGVLKGIITSGKTTLKEITLEVKFESTQVDNKKIKNEKLVIQRIITPNIPQGKYDYGDAINFSSAKHYYPPFELVGKNYKAWLGDNNIGCNQICASPAQLIDFETSNDNPDAFDNGIKFFPLSNYCNECGLDSLDVTITIHPNYKRNTPLLLHAWFDFNRDGDFSDNGNCGTFPNVLIANEHINWLYARKICDNSSTSLPWNQFAINSNVFKIQFNTDIWPLNVTCATFRLYYIKGQNNPISTNNQIWSRFRLTPSLIDNTYAGKLSGQVNYGEVEDYLINCDNMSPNFDFGDAPDESQNSSFHYCTHLLTNNVSSCPPFSNRPAVGFWSSKQAASHRTYTFEWLGPISTNCPSTPCPGISANSECNGKDINTDQYDDGVNFDLFKFPFADCDTQVVEVLINTADLQRYSSPGKKLHLHAWFDWNRNGNWDDYDSCYSLPVGHDHVFWLSGQRLCVDGNNPGNEFNINSFDFVIDPFSTTQGLWQSNCQKYRLKFIAGKNGSSHITDTLWCRFRLSFVDDVASKYWGPILFGEVEDYPIIASVQEQGCSRFYDPRNNGDGDNEGQWYNVIEISGPYGTQCWMQENLNVGTMIDGSLPQLNQTPINLIEKYCFGNDINNCNEYGGLYQWAEAMNYHNGASNTQATVSGINSSNPYTPIEIVQGICPDGWHLPSDEEWKILEMNVEPLIITNNNNLILNQNDQIPDINEISWWRGVNIGYALKEVGNDHWLFTNQQYELNTNSSGFTALGGGAMTPVGYIDDTIYFNEIKQHGHWWSTTEHSATQVLMKHLFSNSADRISGMGSTGSGPYVGGVIGRGGSGDIKINGVSIRCIKD